MAYKPTVLQVSEGGTGDTTLTLNGLLYGNGTGGIQATAAGTVGKFLQAGVGGVPQYSAYTFPTASAAAGTILRSDGTNWVQTFATYPNTISANQLLYASGNNVIADLASANNGLLVTSSSGVPSILAGPGTTGQVLQANAAAAPSFSTATYPSVGTSTGSLLRADGTNWSATTTTYPNTNAINTILYASSANVMSALATANNGVLATNGSGVPSITATPTVTSITFGSGNALNTYVTGTWTPNIQINASSTGITYTTQLGGYTQIGNVVTLWANVLLSSKGASTGTVTISNLPVATGSSGSNIIMSIPYFTGWTLANYTSMGLDLGPSQTIGNLVVAGSGQAGTTVSNSQITNTFGFFFCSSYIVD